MLLLLLLLLLPGGVEGVAYSGVEMLLRHVQTARPAVAVRVVDSRTVNNTVSFAGVNTVTWPFSVWSLPELECTDDLTYFPAH